MIEQNNQNNQLSKELKSVFSELEIFKHLRKARITKKFGFTASYLFQLIFCLIFHHKSWYTLLKSKKGESAPSIIPSMVKRALDAGISANYVLMDTWFTQQPLKSIVDIGLDVIGMVKATNQRYLVNNQKLSLKELYRVATPVSKQKGILRSIHTTMANGIPVKVVFVQNRNKKSEWLAILSTDCSLSEQEIVRIYGMGWDIEVFFKTTKSLLKLQTEFQGMSYDLLVSHTTMVFSRYNVLSWQNRCNTDQRTIGGLFYELCDEVNELDWAVALQQLIELLEDTLTKSNKMIQKLIQSQLQQWIDGLPNHIKAYLSISVCEV
jgi:hypothetical protein